MSVASVSLTAARGAGRTVDRLLDRPRAVLGGLVVGQIAATAALALSVTHNGWVFFHGGDQIWYSTTGWLLAHLELPPTEIGYLWSLVLSPIMLVTGPTYVQALPPLVLLQVLVVGPVALLCVYAIAARIGGRLLGYWAAFLWVITPFASVPLFVDRYQERFAEHFLPQALGLTAMSDYPSMVLLLASAVFLLRSLDGSRLPDAAMAGLLLGAAAGAKPSNLLFAGGAALAFPLARRWREGVVYGMAVLPTLAVLALWKERGLGRIPALTLEEMRLAAGGGLVAFELPIERYVELDLDHWRAQMDYLREFFWSARLVQWAPLAGLLAVLRVRRVPVAGLLAGWLGMFLLIKGFSTRADIQANTFWRLLMPAWPAYLLLVASIPLLVPTLARRLGDRLRPPVSAPLAWRYPAVVAVATIAIPALVILVSSPTDGAERAVVQEAQGNFILTSVDDGVQLRTEATEAGARLTWTTAPWRGSVFYRVYRGTDADCERSDGARAAYCYVRSTPIATTRDLEYVDPAPEPGAYYRVGVGTNWIDDPEEGDVFAFSPPAATP